MGVYEDILNELKNHTKILAEIYNKLVDINHNVAKPVINNEIKPTPSDIIRNYMGY